MAQNEIDALIVQMRKCNQIVKQTTPFTEEQQLELKTIDAMILNVFAHRGPGYEITVEQARELATLMKEGRRLALARGVEPPSFEEAKGIADRLATAPRPERH